MLGVVNVCAVAVPEVASATPALASAYHVNTPDVRELAYMSTVPVPQRLLSVVVTSFTTDALTTVRGKVIHAPLSNST